MRDREENGVDVAGMKMQLASLQAALENATLKERIGELESALKSNRAHQAHMEAVAGAIETMVDNNTRQTAALESIANSLEQIITRMPSP